MEPAQRDDVPLAARGSGGRRVSPGARLDHVVEAAARVFARKGFRRSQMADVAREAGVSPGNLYNYVESKEELFFLVLQHTLGRRQSDQPVTLPVRRISAEETVSWVR